MAYVGYRSKVKGTNPPRNGFNLRFLLLECTNKKKLSIRRILKQNKKTNRKRKATMRFTCPWAMKATSIQ